MRVKFYERSEHLVDEMIVNEQGNAVLLHRKLTRLFDGKTAVKIVHPDWDPELGEELRYVTPKDGTRFLQGVAETFNSPNGISAVLVDD